MASEGEYIAFNRALPRGLQPYTGIRCQHQYISMHGIRIHQNITQQWCVNHTPVRGPLCPSELRTSHCFSCVCCSRYHSSVGCMHTTTATSQTVTFSQAEGVKQHICGAEVDKLHLNCPTTSYHRSTFRFPNLILSCCAHFVCCLCRNILVHPAIFEANLPNRAKQQAVARDSHNHSFVWALRPAQHVLRSSLFNFRLHEPPRFYMDQRKVWQSKNKLVVIWNS